MTDPESNTTYIFSVALALTLPTGGGRSVGIVHSQTKAMEIFLYVLVDLKHVAIKKHKLCLTAECHLPFSWIVICT